MLVHNEVAQITAASSACNSADPRLHQRIVNDMRSIPFLTLFLGAFGGCVSGQGSDAETTTTDSSGASNDADTSTSEADTTSSGSTEATDDDPTTTTTTGGESVSMCALECTSAVDCCVLSGSFGCEDSIGIYPNEFVCGPSGTCSNRGCTSEEACSMFDGGTTHFICIDHPVFAQCMAACDDDDDCFLVSPVSACTGEDATGRRYCRDPGCTSDDSCVGESERCIAGRCEFWCTDDTDCTDGGSCDVATGTCACTDDDACADGFACAPTP